MSAIDWVVCVEQREGAGRVGVVEDVGDVEHFHKHLDAVDDVGEADDERPIHPQVSSRGGHPHRVRRTAAEVRLLKTPRCTARLA